MKGGVSTVQCSLIDVCLYVCLFFIIYIFGFVISWALPAWW